MEDGAKGECKLTAAKTVDREHPSSAAQGADFVSLIQAVRRHLPTPHHLLTTVLPVREYVLKHIDLPPPRALALLPEPHGLQLCRRLNRWAFWPPRPAHRPGRAGREV